MTAMRVQGRTGAWRLVPGIIVGSIVASGLVRSAPTDDKGPIGVGYPGRLRGVGSAGCITSDGRTMAFEMYGVLRVDGVRHVRVGTPQIWARELPRGRPHRVSVNSQGQRANARCTLAGMSDDGQKVLFVSEADNLVDGDSNGHLDVFLHDRITGRTQRVSTADDGTELEFGAVGESWRSLSADGAYAVYSTRCVGGAEGLSEYEQVVVKSVVTGEVRIVSRSPEGDLGDESSSFASISSNGRFVAFCSWASNIVHGDSNGMQDVFVHDLLENATERVSVSSSAAQGDGPSCFPSVSDAGSVAFETSASNLDSESEVMGPGVFLRDMVSGRTRRVVLAAAGGMFPCVSKDGESVVFSSSEDGLVEDDMNGIADVFWWCASTERLVVLSNGAGTGKGRSGGWLTQTGGNLSFDGSWCVFNRGRGSLGKPGHRLGRTKALIVRVGE